MKTYYKTSRFNKSNIIPLIICIVAPLAIGILSSALSGNIKGVYAEIAKPFFAPPNWLFGIVWPILYILIGIALFLVIKSDVPRCSKRIAITLFLIQLALNFAWSPIFFALGAYPVSVVVIIAIDVFVVLSMLVFRSIRIAAGNLLIPYLVWLGIATCLNIGVAVLN